MKYIQVLPAPTEGATENIRKSLCVRNVFNTKHHAP